MLTSAVLLIHWDLWASPDLCGSDLRSIKWALAQVETGATQEGPCVADHFRGKHREVSRYQVLPALWHRRTSSTDYANPTLAWQITEGILAERVRWFQTATGREPVAFDLYVMWNAPGHYHAVGFQVPRLSRVVADRARRFANLVDAANKRAPASAAETTQAMWAIPPADDG